MNFVGISWNDVANFPATEQTSASPEQEQLQGSQRKTRLRCRGQAQTEQLRFAVAGSSCQPWSAFGLQKQESDERHLAWAIWSEERVAHDDALVGFENSESFPFDTHTAKFQQTHNSVGVKVGPEDMGWPMFRRRLYICSCSKEKLIWAGPGSSEGIAAEFQELFSRKVVVDADLFLASGEEAQREFRQQLAATQRTFIRAGEECTVRVTSILSASSRRHYELYQEAYLALQDQQQQPGSSTTTTTVPLQAFERLAPKSHAQNISRALMPSLTCSVLRYSHSRSRFFTDEDLWLAFGWPVMGSAPGMPKMPFNLSDLSRSARMRLLGNSMHLAVLSSFYLYCFSNMVQILVASVSLMVLWWVSLPVRFLQTFTLFHGLVRVSSPKGMLHALTLLALMLHPAKGSPNILQLLLECFRQLGG